MNDQVLSYFINGIRFWGDGDLHTALDNIDYCLTLDPGQCDLYRAKATLAIKMGTDVDQSLIDQIYQTRGTWGRLLTAVNRETGADFPVDYFQGKYEIGYLGLKFDSNTLTGVHIARAGQLSDRQRFDEALSVIEAAPNVTPFVQLATALIYFKASRWNDVITHATPLLNPLMYDALDNSTGQIDPWLQSLGYLLTGIADAHLGNTITASESLRRADAAQVGLDGREFHYRDIGAESCYYLGLLDRAQGDEDRATVYLNNGLAYIRTRKLQDALADTSITLRQTTTELINQRSSYWDVHTEPDLHEVREAEWAQTQSALLTEAEAELDAQIGMDAVKEQIRRFKSRAAFEKELARRGKLVTRESNHLVFTGPPGTGKTTIARVVAKILAGLGICKKDTVVEASRADLVGSHEGESLKMTREVIDRADGGVLFIDEAYEIVQARNSGQVDPFGTEAMTELMREMENRRETLIVIIAGYANEIDRLLATNDGLSGRFKRRITFQTYTPGEIGDIATMISASKDYILPEHCRQIFVDAANRLQGNNAAGKKLLDVAGNGRFVRNVVELAIEEHSDHMRDMNLSALSDEELLTLTPRDIAAGMRKELTKYFGQAAPEIHIPAGEYDPPHNNGEVS